MTRWRAAGPSRSRRASQRARALLESGDAEAALDACVQALTLEETHPGALELEQTIQAVIAAQRAEALRQEAAGELGRAVADVGAGPAAAGARAGSGESRAQAAGARSASRARRGDASPAARRSAGRGARARRAGARATAKPNRRLPRRGTRSRSMRSPSKARELEAEAMRRLDEESARPTRPHAIGIEPWRDDAPVDAAGSCRRRCCRLALQRCAAGGERRRRGADHHRALRLDRTPPPAARRSEDAVRPAAAPRPAPPARAGCREAPLRRRRRRRRARAGEESAAPRRRGPRRDYVGEARASVAQSTASARAAWVARPKKERAMIAMGGSRRSPSLLAIGAVVLDAAARRVPTGPSSIDARALGDRHQDRSGGRHRAAAAIAGVDAARCSRCRPARTRSRWPARPRTSNRVSSRSQVQADGTATLVARAVPRDDAGGVFRAVSDVAVGRG